MNSILTDDERREIAKAADADSSGVASFEYRLIGLTEAAVLAKLREQEPVLTIRTWTKPDARTGRPRRHYEEVDVGNGIDKLPDGGHRLYAAPLPAVVPPGYKLVPVEHPKAAQKVLEAIQADAYVSYQEMWNDLLAAAPEAPAQHPDDAAVDAFAQAMKDKLAAARAKGRDGWQTCPPETLSRMLRDHVEKGDPRDVANFCMFLWSLGHGIAAAPEAPALPAEVREAIKLARKALVYAKGWHHGDKWRFDGTAQQRASWKQHAATLDAALARLDALGGVE